jgi:hypothetical protein
MLQRDWKVRRDIRIVAQLMPSRSTGSWHSARISNAGICLTTPTTADDISDAVEYTKPIYVTTEATSRMLQYTTPLSRTRQLS